MPSCGSREGRGTEEKLSQGVQLRAGSGRDDEGLGVSLGAGVPEPGLQRGPKSLLPAERGLGMSPGATQVGWGGESCRLLSTPRSTPTSTALCGRPPCLHRPPVFSVGSCMGSCSTAPLAAGAPAGGGGQAAGLRLQPGWQGRRVGGPRAAGDV